MENIGIDQARWQVYLDGWMKMYDRVVTYPRSDKGAVSRTYRHVLATHTVVAIAR